MGLNWTSENNHTVEEPLNPLLLWVSMAENLNSPATFFLKVSHIKFEKENVSSGLSR
jgi:hypothetical protein